MPGSQLKATARKLIIENASKILIISLLYVTMAAVLSWLAARLPGTLDLQGFYERLSAGEVMSITMLYSGFRPAGVFIALLLYLLLPIIDLGYMGHCMKIKRGQDTEYKDILDGFQFAVKCLALYLVTSLFVLLWSLLLIVPGIVAAYKYRLAYYILLDEPGKGVMQCIDESMAMMNGGKLDLFIIDLSFLGWVLLDFVIAMLIPLPFMPPVVQIWLAPYRGITNVGFYDFRNSQLTV